MNQISNGRVAIKAYWKKVSNRIKSAPRRFYKVFTPGAGSWSNKSSWASGSLFLNNGGWNRWWQCSEFHGGRFSHHRSVRYIATNLPNATNRVKMDPWVTSDWKTVLKGCPQGSTFGPFMLNIFQNDLPMQVMEASISMYAEIIKSTWLVTKVREWKRNF